MLFFSEESLAQSYNSKSKKAVKCFQKAVKLFDNDKYKSYFSEGQTLTFKFVCYVFLLLINMQIRGSARFFS